MLHGNDHFLLVFSFSDVHNVGYTCTLKCPKIFFSFKQSLLLFETHFAILPLFNPNIDLLQAVKVTKSGHNLSHDRASKGYGSIPCLTSQTSLHACLQRLHYLPCKSVSDIKQGIDPCPLLAQLCDR